MDHFLIAWYGLGTRLIVFRGWLLRIDTSLFHKVADRLLQIIYSVTHLINSTDNRRTHLVESMLLIMSRRNFNKTERDRQGDGKEHEQKSRESA